MQSHDMHNPWSGSRPALRRSSVMGENPDTGAAQTRIIPSVDTVPGRRWLPPKEAMVPFRSLPLGEKVGCVLFTIYLGGSWFAAVSRLFNTEAGLLPLLAAVLMILPTYGLAYVMYHVLAARFWR